MDKHAHNKPPEESNGSGSYYFTRWLGAVFYYLGSLGRQPFSDCSHRQYSRRNFITGYLLTIGFTVLLIIAINLIVFN